MMALLLTASTAFGAMKFATLGSFDGTNGATPYPPLVQAADGTLYGVTPFGGSNSLGVVYKVTADSGLTILHTFATSDGTQPLGALIEAADGDLYGTTSLGGTNNAGTIFRITSNGVLNSLYSFGAATNSLGYDLDGKEPYAGLIQGKDGDFYGVTYAGGISNVGTIFRFSTNSGLTSLYSFTGDGTNSDGAYPYTAPLVEGTPGVFYGTTAAGGKNGDGTVFRITRGGALTVLHEFDNTNGLYPYAGLSWGAGGKLYGTTVEGGAKGYGTVFQVTTNGDFAVLYQFNGTKGAYPEGGVVAGPNAELYGTTYKGGSVKSGTVFRVATNGVLTILYSFTYKNDGGYPYGGVIRGAKGSLYGTALYGGKSKYGTVFRLSDTTPPTLAISSPKSGQRWSNEVFTVTGTAKDDIGVSGVFLSVNNGGWVSASSANFYTNWSAQAVLTPGTNLVSACAMDESGNFSKTNSVKLVYVVYAPLAVSTNGLGSLSPNDNGRLLQIGNSYAIKATPRAGFAFGTWTGGTSLPLTLLTNRPTVRFLMESNLMLEANFLDARSPTLTITTPSAGQHLTNAVATIAGKASDNWKVASVWWQMNGGAWNLASTTNGWTNWTATVGLQSGTDTVRAYAVDAGGNVSTTNSVSFQSSATFTLQLLPPSGQALGADGFTLELRSSPGLSGRVEVSTNLADWTVLRSFAGAGLATNLLDRAATNYNHRFYRIVIP